jgi:hypothetical protein
MVMMLAGRIVIRIVVMVDLATSRHGMDMPDRRRCDGRG